MTHMGYAMQRLLLTIIALASMSVSASPSLPAPKLAGTMGDVRFTISADGKLVTVQNQKLPIGTQVDVMKRCGARAVGDPTRFDVITTDTELQLIYKARCTLKIKWDASDVSCNGCN